ncbi:bifunctional tetrahydrofolate synthase/dihydrofolate synthase [Dokdonella sp.]|jgi:dihydrofolate synthase/folylpolyglutamate synthase|uniref:bifunctional tetrahydrofolate synthase/dihydrofolate synthase n=1 Tax=Dokdonella sp. TaxID=2291710 RepID=UPI002DD6584E|nr:bifunctional tetrahydrofolate synthase/dihydrofolate synthase [Dokdonella sp.]
MQLPETLDGWLSLLEARHGQSIQLGLDRVRAVRDALDLPQTCPVFTVGGTNGKGSTCALLEAVLLAAGYRVGLYTSPHLLRYNERVRIDGRDVEDAVLVDAFAEVERARGDIPLTYFEHGTLAAWVAFCRAGLEAIILEVGLGGRLDAVNVFEPDCAIVTSVAMDHMDYLGDNREAIGFEKAGIFRAGRPAICSDPQPPASLLAHAEAIGARLWVSGRDFGFSGDQNQWAFWTAGGSRRGGLAYPSLRGANQLLNAAAVMAACESVRDILPVPMQAIRQGFMLVELPGRFQVLPGRPSIVLDVAHNPQAAGVLNENLASMGFFPETWAVIGMLADKDVAGVVRLLRDRIDHWLVASLPGPRGLGAEKLAAILREVGVSGDIAEHVSPASAYEVAVGRAAEGDRIVVFGSFLTVAEVMAARNAPQ